MKPSIEILGREISLYSIAVGVGVILACIYIAKRSSKYGIKKDDAFYASLFGFIGLLVGGKVLYLLPRIGEMIEYLPKLTTHFELYMQYFFTSGFVFYGALIGALLGMLIYCRKFKIPTLKLLDLAAPAIAFAHGFGRIGCFLGGCCYGIPMNPPFGMYFKHSPFVAHDVAYFPVQLVESVFLFILAAGLFVFSIKKLKNPENADGKVLGLYIISYSVGRFILEFFRFDEARGFLLSLSTSQIMALLLLPVGIYFLIRKKRKPEAEVKEDTEMAIEPEVEPEVEAE